MDAQELARVVEQLNAEPALDYTLDRTVEHAVANVPGCSMCSVFIRGADDEVRDAATTDPLAQRIDDLQFTLGEGPCLDVLWDREIARVDRMDQDDRWPRWSKETHDQGVGSSLSVRLPIDDELRACLNMYSVEPEAFDDDAVDLAVTYARLAAVAVHNASETAGLRSALQSRLVIGVAQGLLMRQYGISLTQAFEVLRRRAGETDVRLRELAQEIVRTADPSAGALDGAERS